MFFRNRALQNQRHRNLVRSRQGTTPDLGIGECEARGTRIARWCGYRVANMPPEGSDEEDGRTGRESVAC
jgi:hypothetical protein